MVCRCRLAFWATFRWEAIRLRFNRCNPSNIGTLNFDGDAIATVLSDPVLAAVVGSTYYGAVASYDQGALTGREVSVARVLSIVP